MAVYMGTSWGVQILVWRRVPPFPMVFYPRRVAPRVRENLGFLDPQEWPVAIEDGVLVGRDIVGRLRLTCYCGFLLCSMSHWVNDQVMVLM